MDIESSLHWWKALSDKSKRKVPSTLRFSKMVSYLENVFSPFSVMAFRGSKEDGMTYILKYFSDKNVVILSH